MKRFVLLALLVGCGSSRSPEGARGPTSEGSDAVIAMGVAEAENAKLEADYTCACSGDGARPAFCAQPLVPKIPNDDSLAGASSPTLAYKDRLAVFLAHRDTCWGKLAAWEEERGVACVGGSANRAPRPTCGAPPAIRAARVAAWWKESRPCAPGQQLVTVPNPMRKDALLAAYCARTDAAGEPSAVGRITEWHVNGSVASDRDEHRRTDWFPSGQVQADARPTATGQSWTHYFPNGVVSDRGERVYGEPMGPWEGFRPDGTKQYTVTYEQFGANTIVWLDREGRPEPAEEDHTPPPRAVPLSELDSSAGP